MGIPLKLLIIEDSVSDADLAVFKLKKHGYDVIYDRVEDGAGMWQALHEQQWDIIIADHNLPHFDSLRALQVLKDSGLDIPFIIVSGTIGEEIAVQAMKSGAKDYVPKNNLARLGAVVEREVAEAGVRAARKQAELVLQQKEEQYRLLTENIKDVVWVLDAETMYFRYVSPSVERQRGYTPAEVIAQPLTHTFTATGIDRAINLNRSRVQDLLSGKEPPDKFYTEEVEQSCKDGSTVWTEVITSYYVNQENGRVEVRGVTRDITERKNSELKILESQKKFQALVETTNDLIWEMNLNGVYTYCSPQMEKLWGLKPQDMLGKTPFDLIPPEEREQVVNTFNRISQSSSPFENMEVRSLDGTGKIKVLEISGVPFFDIAGKPAGYRGITRDITERKQAGLELTIRSQILNNLREGVNFIRLSDLCVVYTNPVFNEMFGYDTDELIDKPAYLLNAPDGFDPRQKAGAIARDLIQNGGWIGELRNIRKDGSCFWCQVNISLLDHPVFGKIGVSIHQDITELKREEAYREIGQDVLQILNEPGNVQDSIQRVVDILKSQTGFDAVGIRLQDGDDFPYLAQKGFPEDFVLTENSLVERSADGGLCRDKDGNVSLEGTCGLVISGRTDPANPRFTPGGSFWTNDSFPMLDIPLSDDPRLHPRNVCIYQSYASITLIPIRNRDRIIGLLQFNDRRKGCFTLAAVELLEGIASHIGAALMRKRAEEALTSSEYNFRHSMDESPLGIRIVNTRGETLYANKTIIDVYGYDSLDEFVATPAEGRYTPESYTEYQERKSKRQRGEHTPSSYEISIVRKDGEIRHLMAFRKEVFWNGNTEYQVLYQDITEVKQAQSTLIASEQRYRSISGLITDFAFSCTRSRDKDFTVDWIAGAIESITGYSMEKVQQRGCWRFMVWPEDVCIFDKSITALQPGDTANCKLRIIRRDGGIRWLNISSKVIIDEPNSPVHRLYGGAEDITERKRLEDAQIFLLQCGSQGSGEHFFESLAKYLAQSLGMGYVCIDRLEGDGLTAKTVAIYNNGVYEPNVSYALKDTPCGDVVGKTICCFPSDVRQLFPKDAALQDLKAQSYIGTTLWSFDGKPIGLIAIIGQKPLTNPGMAESMLKLVALRAAGELEREMAETENQRLREKAEVSSRLAAVGEMAAGIAHEINNPLTGVIGFSELLLNNQGLAPDVREQIKVIAEGGKRVKDIVKRLLAFARQNKPMKTMASINALIETTLDLRSYVLRTANIEVVKQLNPGLPWQVVDPGQMQQVFLNLIVNAEYAMKKAHGKGMLTITTKKSDDQVLISFRDDGPGISPEAKAKLFNPFFTTKGVGEGTGLGLSLSRAIILDHGGTIEVESELGQGASFIITLPVTPSVEEAPLKAAVAAAAAEKTKAARILVVDDEEVIRFLLSTILAQHGHTVHATGDTTDALNKLASTSYDAVIMDIRMPGLSGMELYRQITAKSPEMAGKFIFITGDTSDQVIRAFLEENNLPYITKPFDRDTLMKKVDGLL